jgi:hypothetical protein
MPSKYWRAFNLWSRIITAICVGGGIWLERYLDVNESYVLYAGVVVVAVALFVGHFLPEFVLTSLMSSWHFRRYLFGGAWIERWSHFLTQPAKVDSPMQRMVHHEDAETVFG